MQPAWIRLIRKNGGVTYVGFEVWGFKDFSSKNGIECQENGRWTGNWDDLIWRVSYLWLARNKGIVVSSPCTGLSVNQGAFMRIHTRLRARCGVEKEGTAKT